MCPPLGAVQRGLPGAGRRRGAGLVIIRTRTAHSKALIVRGTGSDDNVPEVPAAAAARGFSEAEAASRAANSRGKSTLLRSLSHKSSYNSPFK
jgi:hypothetical protein